MLIRVTQDDIRNGVQCDAMLCPVALSLRRSLPGRTVTAGEFTIYIDDGMYAAPVAVEEFIENFDDGAPVQPFEFELELT